MGQTRYKGGRVAQLLKSKYHVERVVAEDLLSYTSVGRLDGSDQPAIIIQYKHDFLTPKLIRKLIRISEQLMAVNHPNILSLNDYYYDGQSFFTIYTTATKLVSLDTLFEKKGHPDTKSLWKISTQILAALIEVESKGLIAGSINLSHIYLTPDNDVRLANLVIPLEIMKVNLHQFPINEDVMFYPPEFIQRQEFTGRSDIYSFGVLLYYFFSGKWPYKFTTKLDSLRKEMIKPIMPFKKLSDKIPGKLETVIRISLEKDPEKRFVSFAELVKTYQGQQTDTVILHSGEPNESAIQKELEESILKERVRSIWKLVRNIVFGVLVASFFLSGYLLYMNYLTAIPEITVPRVKDVPVQNAMTILNDIGLKSDVGGYQFHPVIKKGNVIETKPPGGREVKQSRIIRLFVSKGPIQFMVPDLVGRTVGQATHLLEENNATLIVDDEQYSITYPKGVIIGQIPSANTFLSASQNVGVVVSRGFPVSMSVSQARSFFFSE